MRGFEMDYNFLCTLCRGGVMNKEYLKMADAFDSCVTLSNAYVRAYYSDSNSELRWGARMAGYAAHAINSHDELVEQNENMKLRINQLLSERNATGVAIEKALNGILPEQHSMINRLQMIAGVAANRDELVDEVERLQEALRQCQFEMR